MLRFLNRMIGRLGPGCAIFLALIFAAPALASHVCADSVACAPGAVIAAETPLDAGDACPDCGPACANGCCHAPHSANAPALDAPSPSGRIARAAHWLHETSPPMARPAGPDRPPRI